MVKGELAQGQLKIKPFSCRPLGPPSYGIQGMKSVCTLGPVWGEEWAAGERDGRAGEEEGPSTALSS